MYTDWVLIHRLALELTQRFTGARVQAAGQLPDGRFALQLWQRGTTALLAFDVFAATPVLTVEDAELAIEAEPGFVRRAGRALRGMTIDSIRSRKGDRVLRMDFGTRSRFGVESGYALVAELVPKFGNLLLIKDQTIVGAVKEFSSAENAKRSIAIGYAYEPPPLGLQPSGTRAHFVGLLQTDAVGSAQHRASVAAFRAVVPLLPQMVALSLLTQFAREDSHEDAEDAATRLIERADRFIKGLQTLGTSAMHIYRQDGHLVQAHVVPLHQFKDLAHETGDHLLPLLSESRRGTITSQQSDRMEKRRRALARGLRDREERLVKELREIDRGFERTLERERLRDEGRAIFSTLHERDINAQEEAKIEAAGLFTRYQKLTASIPHLEKRQAELSTALESVQALQWELERAGDLELDDVADAIAQMDGQARPVHHRRAATKRKPLAVTTSSGSRILIGRSPVENADLTFRVARPDDLWFHAQKIPGAHVILQRDDKLAPPEDDVHRAAAFAAFFSKAKASTKVLVDYTLRKHVRKQPAAAPGLVYYTHPKSLYVEPVEPDG